MDNLDSIRSGQSDAVDAYEAVREFHALVAQPNTALVIFFCSNGYDLKLIADEMRRLFVGIQVIGCTTAGELGSTQTIEHTLSGVSFSSSDFTAVSDRLSDLEQFKITTGSSFVESLLQRLESQSPQANADNSFAFMLIDGLSRREELVTYVLQNQLGHFQLFGGSAGDGLDFRKTDVYFDGAFYSDSAVLVLIHTRLPFTLFKSQHFVAGNERIVVTKADAPHRMVSEINGLPAAKEYARLVGINQDELDPMRFASSPLVVVIDNTNYVRSIQKANPDGSLTFFCAIEEGVVLRIAKGVNFMQSLEDTMTQIRQKIGPPQLVLGCDCILRKLEQNQSTDLRQKVKKVFQRNNIIACSTYGEQFHGVHINQTLVGVAIGKHSTVKK